MGRLNLDSYAADAVGCACARVAHVPAGPGGRPRLPHQRAGTRHGPTWAPVGEASAPVQAAGGAAGPRSPVNHSAEPLAIPFSWLDRSRAEPFSQAHQLGGPDHLTRASIVAGRGSRLFRPVLAGVCAPWVVVVGLGVVIAESTGGASWAASRGGSAL